MKIFLRKINYLFKWNRMSRKNFNILNLVLILVYLPLYLLIDISLLNKYIWIFYILLHIVIFTSSMFSRIHDIWKSSWFLILFFIIPWFPIYLMVKKWMTWKNIYGQDPNIIINNIENT